MGTHAEAREEYCKAMGAGLGTAYHLLWNECALLHMRWDEYVALFGKSQDQFDTMNAVAPGFFKSVQDMSWEQILLHLCRFADPAKVAHRRTLSLEALLKFPESKAVQNLDTLIDSTRTAIKFAKDWRHRVLAHADLDHMIDRNAKPLASASRARVQEALAAIVAVLRAVDLHFTGHDLFFGGPSANWGGAVLLRDLRLATRLREERKQRLRSGTARDDDHDHQKWR